MCLLVSQYPPYPCGQKPINGGVCGESTARTGYEKGFSIVALADCAATLSAEEQRFTFEKNLPMFARISPIQSSCRSWFLRDGLSSEDRLMILEHMTIGQIEERIYERMIVPTAILRACIQLDGLRKLTLVCPCPGSSAP
jgi:hypothetical protein